MIYIITIGAFQSLLLVLLMIFSKKRRSVDFLVTALLSFIFFHLLMKFVIYSDEGTSVLKQGFHTFINLAYGPMLWMIAKKVRNDKYEPYSQWYLFLPAAIAAIWYFWIALYSVIEGKVPLRSLDLYNTFIKFVFLPIILIFPFAAFRISLRLKSFWKTEREMIRNVASLFLCISLFLGTAIIWNLLTKTDMLPNQVLRIVHYSLLVLICMAIFRYFIVSLSETNLVHAESQTGPDLGFAQTYGQNVYGINAENVVQNKATKHRTIFLGNPPAGEDVNLPAEDEYIGAASKTMTPAGIKANSVLFEKEKAGTDWYRQVLEKLDLVMTEKKIYTDPDLNLEKLSNISQISRHNISEALNKTAEKNFYLYINEYRTKEVINILDKCRNNKVRPNILAIAFEAGFNSKSSFNLYFKKYTMLTPSEYLKLNT